jgi:hypothetical protein
MAMSDLKSVPKSPLPKAPSPPTSTTSLPVWHGWPPQVWVEDRAHPDGGKWVYIPEAKLICELQRRLDDIGAPLWRTPAQVEDDFAREDEVPEVEVKSEVEVTEVGSCAIRRYGFWQKVRHRPIAGCCQEP